MSPERGELPFRLMLVTDEQPGVVTRVAAALEGAQGHCVAVQLRLKRASPEDRCRIGQALRTITREHGALLLVNGEPALARAVRADGIHLPERTLRTTTCAALGEPWPLLGASVHDADALAQAAKLGASYALLSPIHRVPGKAPPLGVDGFRALAHRAQLPVLALGGITNDDIAPLRAAGAWGIAVIRAVFLAPSPSEAMAQMLHRLAEST